MGPTTPHPERKERKRKKQSKTRTIFLNKESYHQGLYSLVGEKFSLFLNLDQKKLWREERREGGRRRLKAKQNKTKIKSKSNQNQIKWN